MKNRKPEPKKSPTYLETGISIAGEAVLKRTLYVHGSTSLQGTFSVAGKSELNGDVVASRDADIGGNASVGGTLIVDDHAIFKSPVSIKTTLQTYNFACTEQAVFAEARFGKKVDFVDIQGAKATFSQMNIREGLLVAGDALFANSAQVEKDLYLSGCGYLKKHLTVAGITNLEGGVTTEKDLVVGDNIHVGKQVFVGGELGVHGNATYKNNVLLKKQLNVKGMAAFEDTVEAEDIVARNIQLDGDVEASFVTAKALQLSAFCKVGANLTVEKNIESESLHVSKGIECKSHVSRESHVKENLTVDGDITVASDAIIKKGLCVVGNVVFNETHCDELHLPSGQILSGAYHPEVFIGENIAYFVAYECHYTRVGDVVTVGGRIDLEPEEVAKTAKVEVSLPIPTSLDVVGNLSGSSTSQDGKYHLAVFGDPLKQRAQMVYEPSVQDRCAFFFTFMYRIMS